MPQVRVRSLHANLGGGILAEARFDFAPPGPAQSIPIRFPPHRFPAVSSVESYSTSSLRLLSPILSQQDSGGHIAV